MYKKPEYSTNNFKVGCFQSNNTYSKTQYNQNSYQGQYQKNYNSDKKPSMYRITPKSEPIISAYSHQELESAIKFLDSAKNLKNDGNKEKLVSLVVSFIGGNDYGRK